MHNTDIETFYSRIKKSIDLVVAYSGNKNYKQFIRCCRLKPTAIFGKRFNTKTRLYKVWFDEYGNSINIETGLIKFNDTDLPPKSKQTTDLFYGVSFSQHIAKSIRGLFLGNDFPELIAFYGRDEYVRCVNVGGFGMQRVSPFVFGVELISKLISSNPNSPMEIKMPDELAKTYKRCVIAKVDDTIKIEELFNEQ